MKRGGPLTRRTPLVSHTAMPTRAELARRAPMRNHRPKRTTTAAEGVTEATRLMIAARSGYRCELGGCDLNATGMDAHHRQLRRSQDHRPLNLLAVCRTHHGQIHSGPSVAYENGWMVRQTGDPATTPVRLHDGRLVLLTEDGTYQETQ